MWIALIIILSLFLGFKGPEWLYNAFYRYEKNKILKALTPLPVNENRLCTGLHSWINATTIDDNNIYSTTKLCDKCGFIPERNLMATLDGLERIEKNNKLMTFNSNVEKEFTDKEMEELKKNFEEEIKNGLNIEKIFAVYNSGQTAYQRFVIFKIEKSESDYTKDSYE